MQICLDCLGKVKIRDDGTICIKPECGSPCPACICCEVCPEFYCITLTPPTGGDCECIGEIEFEVQQLANPILDEYFCEWYSGVVNTGCGAGHALGTLTAAILCDDETCMWELDISIGTFGLPPYTQISLTSEKPFCRCPPTGEWEMTVNISTQIGKPPIDCSGDWTVSIREGTC